MITAGLCGAGQADHRPDERATWGCTTSGHAQEVRGKGRVGGRGSELGGEEKEEVGGGGVYICRGGLIVGVRPRMVLSQLVLVWL